MGIYYGSRMTETKDLSLNLVVNKTIRDNVKLLHIVDDPVGFGNKVLDESIRDYGTSMPTKSSGQNNESDTFPLTTDIPGMVLIIFCTTSHPDSCLMPLGRMEFLDTRWGQVRHPPWGRAWDPSRPGSPWSSCLWCNRHHHKWVSGPPGTFQVYVPVSGGWSTWLNTIISKSHKFTLMSPRFDQKKVYLSISVKVS